MKIKLKRGLSSNITAITLDTGEPAFCTDTGKLYIGDGTSNVLVNPVYTHPATHSADMIVDGTTNKAYTATEKNKLAGIETGANKTTIANNLTETIPGKALDATQGKALNDAVVHNTGDETITGTKLFTQSPMFSTGFNFGSQDDYIEPRQNGSLEIAKSKVIREVVLTLTPAFEEEEHDMLKVRSKYGSNHKVWHEGNDGHTSGLDADTLDGKHNSDMVHIAGTETITGTKTFSTAPFVPTPTADTHPATKKYVDDLSASDVGAVATTDIADNLTTNDATKVLSAKQGKVLAEQISTKLNANLKGVVNGVAELDEAGKVPASQLPSYVDDVLEYDNQAGFPTTGETGKIYVAKNTNKTYRWSGSGYVEISASLALGTTSSTAFRGDYGQIAYTHSQSAHAPSNAQKNSDITKAEIEAKLTGTITTHSHTVTKGDVGLGNVTNESKATMFTSPTFTGTPKTPTPAKGTNTTQIASTAYVMTALGDYIKKTDTIDGGTF